MTHASLFSGIGGIDLAAEWAGFRTVAQVERDLSCLKVLERYWPNVHRCREIRDFPDQDYGAITLVSGGFPCQPFSAAGKRRGKEDDRYLWPEMLRVIREVAPRWVLAENVPGILSLEQGILFEHLLNDLEASGYEIGPPLLIPASGVGANHRRERVFVVAHAESERTGRRPETVCQADGRQDREMCGEFVSASQDVANPGRSGRIQQKESRRETGKRPGDRSQDVADALNDGSCGTQGNEAEPGGDKQENGIFERDGSNPTGSGFQNGSKNTMGESREDSQSQRSDWWAVEPDVGRVAHGISHRVDRLRCLGNAVVPGQVYPILQAIAEVEHETLP